MNKNLIHGISSLPIRTMERLAEELGNPTDDLNDLMELGGLFIEEVVDKDVESDNPFSAFVIVRDSLRERWLKYIRIVSDARCV